MTSWAQDLLMDALDEVNRLYAEIPDAYKPDSAPWDALDREVDAAFAAGDRGRVERAVEAWRGHWTRKFRQILSDALNEGRQ